MSLIHPLLQITVVYGGRLWHAVNPVCALQEAVFMLIYQPPLINIGFEYNTVFF